MFLRSICLAFCLFVPAAYSQERHLSDQDWQQIRSVIAQQLAAFQRDDAETAFSFASPNIRKLFQTPANFIAMVKSEYQAVYRPRSVTFMGPAVIAGQVQQPVQLLGPDNAAMVAIYSMEQQEDGTWKIDGCELTPSGGVYT
jgi:ketosteroid isomerase-like protein